MIPLMKSTFLHEQETLKALSDWIATYPKQLSMGEKCSEFERLFARQQKCRHAILFNSGASANLAIIQALLNLELLHPGDPVGFSALTWATNVMPLMQLDLYAVPIDVDPETMNVMSYTLDMKAFHKLKALFITNALGLLPDLDNIRRLCADHGVLLIEDNCESLGSSLKIGGLSGNFGIASSFSFYVAHHMSTIEGGMVCTSDNHFAEMVKMVRANGWDRNLAHDQQAKWRTKYRIADEFEAKYTFYVPAFNMRPTEITGFLGIEQMQYLHASLIQRNIIFREFEAVVKRNQDFIPLRHDHMHFLSPFAFPVLTKSTVLRDKYVKCFGGAGVEVRPVIAGNIVKQPFWKTKRLHVELPGAEQVDQCGFYFGIYPELTEQDRETIKSCLAGW